MGWMTLVLIMALSFLIGMGVLWAALFDFWNETRKRMIVASVMIAWPVLLTIAYVSAREAGLMV